MIGNCSNLADLLGVAVEGDARTEQESSDIVPAQDHSAMIEVYRNERRCAGMVEAYEKILIGRDLSIKK